MRKKAVWTASVLGAAALLAAFCLLLPRRYPVPADTTIGTRSIRYEDRPKTAAEIIAARWAEVDGLTATIKGAQTAAPVVWLAGDTKPHAKAIEADGGKWSVKKNAYYFRVA